MYCYEGALAIYGRRGLVGCRTNFVAEWASAFHSFLIGIVQRSRIMISQKFSFFLRREIARLRLNASEAEYL